MWKPGDAGKQKGQGGEQLTRRCNYKWLKKRGLGTTNQKKTQREGKIENINNQ